MTKEVTNIEKIRRLPWSIATDSANTAFLQLTFVGSVFVLFLSELGLGKGETGLMFSLLPFASVVALFVAPHVARFGYKRTFLIFFGARTVTAVALLFTPWVMARFGHHGTLYYIITVVAIFGLLRSVGITAYFPWAKEYVPDSIRGKYVAINNAISGITGFAAIVGAKFALERLEGLSGFMLLLAIGVGLGLLAIAAATRIPGGAPNTGDESQMTTNRDLKAALQDHDFLYYLIGVGIYVVAVSPMFAFLPLFMQEEVGLKPGNIVLLQAGTLVGSLLTGYLWGWLADRYGSKPVLLSGLTLTMLLPVAWAFMPRGSNLSFEIALVIAFVQGIANLGWNTGANRLLYVNVVPPEKKDDYMALYFAWVGVVGGMVQLLAGWLLAHTQNLRGTWGLLTVDPYLPLFVAGAGLPIGAILLLRAVRTSDAVSPGEFINLLLRGNPLVAMEGLIGLHWAKDERTAVVMTQRLGQADSPLAEEELIEGLSDPRFWVRFETLIAMAQMQPDERLRSALVEVLNAGDPVLSVVAAWALGRMGDRDASHALRQTLEADSGIIKGYSARSLGMLEDRAATPVLLERLEQESDLHLKIAYASALGQLRVKEAIPSLLALLRTSEDEISRMEVSLALARIVGQEHQFIQLWRQVHQDAATATAQTLLGLKKKVNEFANNQTDLLTSIEECAETLSREQLAEGVELIRCLIDKLPQEQLAPHCCTILHHCVESLEEHGHHRMEYIVLTLHAMNGEWLPLMQAA
jgi:MFS family permease